MAILEIGLAEIGESPSIQRMLNEIIESAARQDDTANIQDSEHDSIDTNEPTNPDDTSNTNGTERSVFEAYRNYISALQPFEVSYREQYSYLLQDFESSFWDPDNSQRNSSLLSWSIQDIQFAELFDFNNDGTPELVLILNDSTLLFLNPQDDPYDLYRHMHVLIVLGYNDGYAEVLYKGLIERIGAAFACFTITTTAEGRSFLGMHLSYDSAYYCSEYFELINGMMTSYRVFESIAVGTNSHGLYLKEYSVNSVVVGSDVYVEAYSVMGDGEQEIFLGRDTKNDVQATLRAIGF
jgi:hypothetical protein